MVLNYIVTFSRRSVFHELETGKTIGTGCERNGLYEIELTSDQVACINTSTALDYYCQLGHIFLPTLNFFS